MMKTKRNYDDAFKQMAVELSYAKGSVTEAARELAIDPNRITHWRARIKMGTPLNKASAVLTEDQKEVKRLQWELKDAQLERDILKKAVSIFSKKDGRYSGL
jgi:transposase